LWLFNAMGGNLTDAKKLVFYSIPSWDWISKQIFQDRETNDTDA
jgi:hypothetical protein